MYSYNRSIFFEHMTEESGILLLAHLDLSTKFDPCLLMWFLGSQSFPIQHNRTNHIWMLVCTAVNWVLPATRIHLSNLRETLREMEISLSVLCKPHPKWISWISPYTVITSTQMLSSHSVVHLETKELQALPLNFTVPTVYSRNSIAMTPKYSHKRWVVLGYREGRKFGRLMEMGERC